MRQGLHVELMYLAIKEILFCEKIKMQKKGERILQEVFRS
jgi:hypothetical protein